MQGGATGCRWARSVEGAALMGGTRTQAGLKHGGALPADERPSANSSSRGGHIGSDPAQQQLFSSSSSASSSAASFLSLLRPRRLRSSSGGSNGGAARHRGVRVHARRLGPRHAELQINGSAGLSATLRSYPPHHAITHHECEVLLPFTYLVQCRLLLLGHLAPHK